MKRGAWALAMLAVAVGAVALWWSAGPEPGVIVSPPQPAVMATPSKRVSVPPPSSSTPPAASSQVVHLNPRSMELAAQLNAPGGDPARDVILLHQILSQYQRALQSRQGTPIGDDIDLARALKGHNPMRLAFLPLNHPALASDGHLLDRWGTPYHLHPRGKNAFEVRSAGPDRKLFTNDDLIANPPPHIP